MKRVRGFTLIEVMVAITLLSMVVVATIAAMRTLGNTRSSVEKRTQRADEIRVISEFLRDTIGAAMPLIREGESDDLFGGDSRYGTYFAGDSTRLVWVAPLLGGAEMGGVFILYLAWAGDALELRWHPYQRDVEGVSWSAVEPRKLLHSVEEFEVGYLGSYGQEWVSTWEGSHSNPVAVRINIRAAGKYWPELVVRLSGAEMNSR